MTTVGLLRSTEHSESGHPGQTGRTQRRVSILGSTGSVGSNTVDLVSRNPDRFRAISLSANTNAQSLAEQAIKLQPEFVCVADDSKYAELKSLLKNTNIEFGAGRNAILEAASLDCDFLMAAIVGAAGLEPTLRAVKRGAIIGLANKECLVSAGTVFTAEVQQNGATLLPVDSEHNAIFQVLDSARPEFVERVILTASGGPFRTYSLDQMAAVTPSQAISHPNWQMGKKISVDSATMMNKGLELIEAFHLFPIAANQIEILVHPQSIIHSLVEYSDGSQLAQLGSPDMRIPISYCLGWPDRIETPCTRLRLAEIGALTFENPDEQRFPALRLARQALTSSESAGCVLNAANEVAVSFFLNNAIAYLDIMHIVEEVLGQVEHGNMSGLDDVIKLDRHVRQRTETLIKSRFLRE